jgi:hypothetical protein
MSSELTQLICFLCRYFEVFGAMYKAQIKESFSRNLQELTGKYNLGKL